MKGSWKWLLICLPSSVVSFLIATSAVRPKLARLYSSASGDEPTITSTSSSNKQLRKKKLNTFARYLEVESWKNPENRALEPVLRSIGEACKQITRIVQRAQTDDLYGVASDTEETNIQGEIQQKLDVVCNKIMLKQFCGSTKGVIAAVASEEEEVPRTCCDIMVRHSSSFIWLHLRMMIRF